MYWMNQTTKQTMWIYAVECWILRWCRMMISNPQLRPANSLVCDETVVSHERIKFSTKMPNKFYQNCSMTIENSQNHCCRRSQEKFLKKISKIAFSPKRRKNSRKSQKICEQKRNGVTNLWGWPQVKKEWKRCSFFTNKWKMILLKISDVNRSTDKSEVFYCLTLLSLLQLCEIYSSQMC